MINRSSIPIELTTTDEPLLVCPECFGSKGLQRRLIEVRSEMPNDRCDFHPTKKGVPIAEVAKVVDPVFKENYGGGIPDGRWEDSGLDLTEVIYELTEASNEDVVEALSSELIELDDYWPPDGGEAFYSSEYSYHQRDIGEGDHGTMWVNFRRSLLHGQRFFNSDAVGLIAQIFDGIQHQRDTEGKRPIYLIQPGDPQSTFLRARIADDQELRARLLCNPADELGPPPERLRRAGRLNPSGVITFYAAFDFETCVAELRPSVGSMVAAASFSITEEILVLDTTRFEARPKEPNPFAREALRRSAQWRFMRSFMYEIARPIAPGDEHLDYIPTQAVAEYLVHRHKLKFNGEMRTVDAIIYRSAQRPAGKNIALLGKAAICGPAAAERKLEKQRLAAREYDALGWAFPDFQEDEVRVVPVPDTIRIERVQGATYETSMLPDPYDEDFV